MRIRPPKPVVVCVDDERETLAALHRLLGDEPYHLLTTDRPEEALQWTREREVAVVVADQRMPGMMGSDLLTAVRKGSPGTVSVMLTGYPDSRAQAQCSTGVIRRLITKPWDNQDLRAAIREAVREGRVNEPLERRDTEDLVHTIDLSEHTEAEALETLIPVLQFAKARDRGAFVFLKDLQRLRGSISHLLWRLAEGAEELGVRLALADATGMARIFVQNVPGVVPLAAFGPRPSPRSTRKILIVEDDPDSGDFLGAVVESDGHSFEKVESADEAIRLIDAGGFDLVLLDLDLPNGDGLRVAEHAARKDPAVPVVVVSAFLDRWDPATYQRLGIRGRVSKPYRVKDILQVIRAS